MEKGTGVGPDHEDYLYQVKELTEYYDQIDEAKKKKLKEFQEYSRNRNIDDLVNRNTAENAEIEDNQIYGNSSSYGKVDGDSKNLSKSEQDQD